MLAGEIRGRLGYTRPKALLKIEGETLIRTGQLSAGPIQTAELFICYAFCVFGVSTVLYVNPVENVLLECCCLFAVVVFSTGR